MVNKECIECGNRENLLLSGGQFCGGDWWICQSCDDKNKKFAQWMKSEEFLDLVHKANKGEKYGSKD